MTGPDHPARPDTPRRPLPRPAGRLRSLQTQLLLWAILPVTLVVIGLSLTGVYSHQSSMRDFVAQRDLLLARMLAQSLRDALSHGTVTVEAVGAADWLPVAADDLPGSALVLDGQGHILAHSDVDTPASLELAPVVHQITSQSEGAVLVEAPDGGMEILTFSSVPGIGWWVVVRAQVDDLVGPILKLSSFGPAAAVAALALSLVILTFGWTTIARPLQQLSKAASQVSWGDHGQIERDIKGVSEIRDLHNALHEMVERLESYQVGLLDYVDAVTKGQEEERARLAREIHDGPVQDLIALIQRTELLTHRVQRGELEGAVGHLDGLRSAEVGVVEELRRTVSALRPAYLEDLGLLPALEALVRSTADLTDAQVTLQADGLKRRLAPDVALAAFRIAQESLNNAVQHAQADHIVLSVAFADDLVLRVTDDGVGFVPSDRLSSYTRAGHFGLVGQIERARQLGGYLTIDSGAGTGAHVTLTLPIDDVDTNSGSVR